MIAIGARGAYDSYPICFTIRHTCKSRRLDLNVNIDGSAKEHTKTHTHVRLRQIELSLFTLCDASFVFWAEISAQVMIRRPITRSICRIGPIVGIGLPVGSTIVVGLTYEPHLYKTNKMTCVPSEDSDQPGHPPNLISFRRAQTE